MELVEANEKSRKDTAKPSTSSVSSLSSSRRHVELPSCKMNGDVTSAAQRESILSPRSPLSPNNSSTTVSPLTGNVLGGRGAREDIASSRLGNHLSSYSNGPTVESHRGRARSSSSYESRLAPFSTNSSLLSRFDGPASDSLAGRVIDGVGAGKSGYGERSRDVVGSYTARSRLDDTTSPAARLQSLRDSYSSSMWNDSVTSPPRLSAAGMADADGMMSSSAMSRLSTYDADPTSELFNGTVASSRYERVMSARSRSAMRRGDASASRDRVLSAARNRATSPVEAARYAMNDLLESMHSTSVEHKPTTVRSPPLTLSSRAERMKSYGVGATTQKTDDIHTGVTTPTSVRLRTQLSETTIPPFNQPDDATPENRTASETSSGKTSARLVNGNEKPLQTEMPQTLVVDKSPTQPDTAVFPSATPIPAVTLNHNTRSTEPRDVLLSSTSPVQVADKMSENVKVALPTKALETTVSEAKSKTSGATSLETGWSRKEDVDDIAGASLSADILNRLQAAAAAAANAAGSIEARSRLETKEETTLTATTPNYTSSPVTETLSSSSSSPEHSTTTAEDTDGKDGSVSVSMSPLRTSRARSRAPASVHEMLVPSASQTSIKSPSSVSRTNDITRSGHGRQLNASLSSPSSGKAAKLNDSASKSVPSKSTAATVKSRSKMVANVRQLLVPATSGDGETDVQVDRQVNVTSTASNTSTPSRSRTSSTSSTKENTPTYARPVKPNLQSSPKPVQPQATSASRCGPKAADRGFPGRPGASSSSSQQTSSSEANKVTRPVTERKTATKPATKLTSETVSKTSMAVGEDSWKTALTDIIRSTSASDEVQDGSEQAIQSSTSTSSLQSEPPPSQSRRKSSYEAGLSSLMRPTAASLARHGSVSDTRVASYAAPTSSSAAKTTSTGMSRTSSSPALRVAAPLSIASRSGSSSGRTTPTSPRRITDTTTGLLQVAARAARTGNTAAATPARPPRPGTTTPRRTPTVMNGTQRGASQTAGRTNNRSRHNSGGSSSSGDSANRRE